MPKIHDLGIRGFMDASGIKKGAREGEVAIGHFTRKASDSMVTLGKNIRTISVMMAGLGIAGTFALTKLLKPLAEFQQGMADVSTMLDDVDKHMGDFTKGVIQLSTEVGESVNTLSRGLYQILSATIEPAKALEVLRVSAKAAAAGLTDTETAADALTTILNSYQLNADQAAHVSDILFMTVKRGKIRFSEIASQIGKVAASAAAAGIPLEELGAAIATITRAGVPAEQALTALNAVIRVFFRRTEKSKLAALEHLGFVLDLNAARALGLSGVLRLLARQSEEVVAAIFPNVRALRALMAALQQTTGFTEDLSYMYGAAGATEEAFRKQTATLSFEIKRLGATFKALIIEVFQPLLPMMQGLTNVLSEFLDLLRFLPRPLRIITAYFVGLAPPIMAIVGGIGLLYTGFGKLAATVPLLGVLTKAVTSLSAAFTALVAASPVGAVFILTVALTSLGVAIYNLVKHMISARREAQEAAASLEGTGEASENLRKKTLELIDRYFELKEKLTTLKEGTEDHEAASRELADVTKKLGKTFRDTTVEVNKQGEAIKLLDERLEVHRKITEAIEKRRELEERLKAQRKELEGLQKQILEALKTTSTEMSLFMKWLTGQPEALDETLKAMVDDVSARRKSLVEFLSFLGRQGAKSLEWFLGMFDKFRKKLAGMSEEERATYLESLRVREKELKSEIEATTKRIEQLDEEIARLKESLVVQKELGKLTTDQLEDEIKKREDLVGALEKQLELLRETPEATREEIQTAALELQRALLDLTRAYETYYDKLSKEDKTRRVEVSNNIRETLKKLKELSYFIQQEFGAPATAAFVTLKAVLSDLFDHTRGIADATKHVFESLWERFSELVDQVIYKNWLATEEAAKAYEEAEKNARKSYARRVDDIEDWLETERKKIRQNFEQGELTYLEYLHKLDDLNIEYHEKLERAGSDLADSLRDAEEKMRESTKTTRQLFEEFFQDLPRIFTVATLEALVEGYKQTLARMLFENDTFLGKLSASFISGFKAIAQETLPLFDKLTAGFITAMKALIGWFGPTREEGQAMLVSLVREGKGLSSTAKVVAKEGKGIFESLSKESMSFADKLLKLSPILALFLTKPLEDLTEKAKNSSNLLANIFGSFFDWLFGMEDQLSEAVTSFFGHLIGLSKDQMGILRQIVSGYMNKLIWDLILGAIKRNEQVIKDAVGRLIEEIKKPFEVLWGDLKSIFGLLFEDIIKILSPLRDFAVDLAATLVKPFVSTAALILAPFVWAAKEIVNVLHEMLFQPIKDWLEGIFQPWFEKYIIGIEKRVLNVISRIVHKIIDELLMEKLFGGLKEVGSKILGFLWEGMIKKIFGFFGGAILRLLGGLFGGLFGFSGGGIVPAAKKGGLVPSFQEGGIVSGPGEGRDSVLIRAEPGELILPADLTKQLLQVIRRKPEQTAFQAGGIVPSTTTSKTVVFEEGAIQIRSETLEGVDLERVASRLKDSIIEAIKFEDSFIGVR